MLMQNWFHPIVANSANLQIVGEMKSKTKVLRTEQNRVQVKLSKIAKKTLGCDLGQFEDSHIFLINPP